MKFISRGDTTVADAYLSPILKYYTNRFIKELTNKENDKAVDIKEYKNKLLFMQSNGGLIDADNFRGKDSIPSGPAGGIVGAVQVCKQAGFDKVITFDMGGTSTDVAHYNGEYEKDFETEIAGVRLRTPILSIHTIAAGGGSVLNFDKSRYRVGPKSAGADPGPASYRKGGPLTVTDCNVMLGRFQSQFFPSVFGEDGDQPLDYEQIKRKFDELINDINNKSEGNRKSEEVAAGFLDIAVENMANAIKEISLQRGYDITNYTLCCFGGAGGQHACQIAENLGIEKVLIHPYAGVLSAYGMGLADIRVIKQQAVEKELTKVIKSSFEKEHKQLYGFIYDDKDIILESISVEVIKQMDIPKEQKHKPKSRTKIKPEAVGRIS
nr:hydantoinase/oxoprolinase family protein [Selenihalanaerobacter shriftii]